MALNEFDSGKYIKYSSSVGNFSSDYKDKSNAWLQVFKINIENAIGAMADSIKSKAQISVPFKSGALHDSARVEGSGMSREIIFGGNGINYGAYQERGERFDGTHIVRNYTTIGTNKNYLKNATEVVIKEGIKRYLR